MFTAKIKQDSVVLNVLDAKWQEQGELLRGLTQRGELVCPHCGQDILLRDGEVRRRHFAHRTLAECPFKEQSAEVLDIKVKLYAWLESRLPGKVKMDCRLDIPGKEVFWDFLVEGENGRQFGYWIFDRQIRDREDRLDAARDQGIRPVIFHTKSVLNYYSKEVLELTASQREFSRRSLYDEALQVQGGHLHFLNREGAVKIFRGLKLYHKPNLYEWELRRIGPLNEAQLDVSNGELVFPEDQKAKQKFAELKKKRELEKAARRKKPPAAKKTPPKSSLFYRPQHSVRKISHVRESPAGGENRFNQPYECEACGQMTRDWIKLIPKTGKCLCRVCNKNRFSG